MSLSKREEWSAIYDMFAEAESANGSELARSLCGAAKSGDAASSTSAEETEEAQGEEYEDEEGPSGLALLAGYDLRSIFACGGRRSHDYEPECEQPTAPVFVDLVVPAMASSLTPCSSTAWNEGGDDEVVHGTLLCVR